MHISKAKWVADQTMKIPTRAARLARFILVTACLILPTLSLLPLGGLYLWEKGWLLHWAVLALCVSGTIALIEVLLLRREVERQPKGASPLPGPAGMLPQQAPCQVICQPFSSHASGCRFTVP